MASEISVQGTLTVRNGYLYRQHTPGRISVDQATLGGYNAVLSIGTSEEAIALTDVANAGWAYFRNLDEDNFVEIGPTSGGAIVPFIRLEPGEYAICRLTPAVALRAQADTAAVKLEVSVFSD